MAAAANARPATSASARPSCRPRSINLVRADDLQGPTMTLVEQAGHCLINAGEAPVTPEAYRG